MNALSGFFRARLSLAASALACSLFFAPLPLVAAPAPSPLIPPHSTVILLSGIPGDVESETAYRDQTQAWLDALGAAGSTGRVFVLCDDPAAFPTLPTASVQKEKGNRDSFLKLGPSLAPINALLVVAWGHGGNQGPTPVFHVRGPRLTPDDFAAFATEAGAAPSNWILLFRGSGAFARALTAPGRQILSSECDTAFTSDPVGMGLLLKLLRDEPSLPFDALARKFGGAVQRWYSDRSLARTEEPTLWLGTDKPVLLASAGDGGPVAVAPGKPGAPDLSSATSTPPTQAEAPEAAQLPASLPPAWRDIKRVDPRDYPNDDAVFLKREVRYVLGDSPAVSSDQEQFIQALTPEGKRFGDFSLHFSPPFEDVTFEDCEVLLPDGHLVRLNPDDIHEAADPASGDEQPSRRKLFSLPGVGPGAIIHVRLRSEWKKFPLPHFSMSIPVLQSIPVLRPSLTVSVPRDTPFHFALEGVAGPDPSVSQTSYGSTYSWTFPTLDAFKPDPLAPPGARGSLLVSTFPDWAALSAWYERMIRLVDAPTPELTSKAQELTRGATNDLEKVQAIYRFVTGLRYVAVPLGVSSLRPHAAAAVLQNQFGDCKDKANLFNTLLRAVNIRADLVLVPRFARADPSLPGMFFNHAISRVSLANQPLWIDTTDDICAFGMLPPGDLGRRVLVIDGSSTNLDRLPDALSAQHSLKLNTTVQWAPDADCPASLRVSAKGFPDYILRSDARELRDQSPSAPLLAASLRPAAGSFALAKQQAASIAAFDQNFVWSAEGAFVGLAAQVGRQHVVRPPFWLPAEWDITLHQRTSPLFLNQGYPLTLDEEVEFAFPTNTPSVTTPALRENASPPLRWRVAWSAPQPGNKWVARFTAELSSGELTPAETAMFQKQLRALLTSLAEGAVVSPPNQ